PSFLQDPPGAVGSFSAPGDQVNRPSRSRTDRSMFCFCMFFLLGFLVEETPCEHGENMQTPHIICTQHNTAHVFIVIVYFYTHTHTQTHTHRHTHTHRPKT